MGHARAATGAGALADADASVTLDNPLCGDRVTMQARLSNGAVAAIAHRVRGCVLCQAAASVIGAHAPGATPADVAAARDAVRALLEDGVAVPEDAWPELSVFTPVAGHKNRHECVLLPFEALVGALTEAGNPRSGGPVR